MITRLQSFLALFGLGPRYSTAELMAPPSEHDSPGLCQARISHRWRWVRGAESQEIEGLTGPRGLSLGEPRAGKQSYHAELAVWRHASNPPTRRQLNLVGNIAESDGAALQALFAPGMALRLRVKLGPPEANQYAQLISVVGPAGEMFERSEEVSAIKSPVVIEDPDLGTLTLNRQPSWFLAKAELNDGIVTLIVDADEEDRPVGLNTMKTLKADLTAWDEAARLLAFQQLFSLSEDWRDDDRDPEPISAEAFDRRLRLELVRAGIDGRVSFDYDAGGMFTEHGVSVSGSLAEGLISANIQ